MTSGQPPAQAPDHTGPVLFLLGLVMVGFLVLVWGLGREVEEPSPPVEPPPFQQDRDRDRAPEGDQRDRDRDGDRGPRDGSGARDGQQAHSAGA